jgi:hypothetical protein
LSTEQITYIRWGDYKSKDANKPDILEVEVITLEFFESKLSTNVLVKLKENDSWQEKLLPLKSHESANGSLLKQWNELVDKKKIKIGGKILIKTSLGISRYHRVIRNSRIEV